MRLHMPSAGYVTAALVRLGLIVSLSTVAGCPGGIAEKDTNEVVGFFRGDEPWQIAQNFSVGGHGATLEFVLLPSEDLLSVICFGRVTQGEVTYEDSRLHVTAEFTDFETGRTCSLEIDAQAAQCACESGTEPAEYCALTEVTGVILVDGQEYAIDEATVARKPPCDSVPTVLTTH